MAHPASCLTPHRHHFTTNAFFRIWKIHPPVGKKTQPEFGIAVVLENTGNGLYSKTTEFYRTGTQYEPPNHRNHSQHNETGDRTRLRFP